jgi:hypothetical protein
MSRGFGSRTVTAAGRRRARLASTALAACTLLTSASCNREAPPPPPADLLLVGGKVYTLTWGEPDPEGVPASDAPFGTSTGWTPDAQAVGMRDGKIIFVGSTVDADAYRGDSTLVIQLRGRAVIPGLIDSHVHIADLGAKLDRVDLTGVLNEVDAIQRVSARAASTPKGEWIVGQGWDEGAWANHYPTMELLSKAVPDHPVFLRGLHSYAVWGNRLAFQRAGITRATRAPEGGEILKDSTGAPSGVLVNAAVQLLQRALPPLTLEQQRQNIVRGLSAMAKSGYVEVHEAGADSLEMAALESLAAEHKLPIRVYAMLSARDTALLSRWRARGIDTADGDMLVVRAVKAFADGALGSRGARLLEEYADKPGYRGVTGSGIGFDTARVAAMMRAGFQVAVHAIGDAANRETLDFIERVVGTDSTAARGRPRIEHAQVVHPDDVGRFASLGVIASMEPSHAVEDMAWAEERLGPDRIQGAYAWRTMRLNGVQLTFNSDLPGTDYDIFYGLHSAITRRGRDKLPPGGWYGDQVMTPDEAIRGFTAWAAYAGFEEDRAGRIARDMRADLTVLEVDPFQLGFTAPGSLLGKKPSMTIIAGRVFTPPS